MDKEITTTNGRTLVRIGDGVKTCDKVVFVYNHCFNWGSSAIRFKNAVFLTYLRPDYCLIYIPNNSTASKVKLKQVYYVSEINGHYTKQDKGVKEDENNS